MYDHSESKYSSKPTKSATSQAERRGGNRHPFIAAADVFELSSGSRFSTRTTDLGPGGCFLDTLVPFEAGAKVRMVARRASIELHSRMALPRSLAETVRHPISPIGPGWKHRFFSDLPLVFHNLPKPAQYRLAKGFLGPAGGWFLRGRFDLVSCLAGYQIKRAEASGDRAILWVRSADGEERRIETEHVIAATGYEADIRRLPFLGSGIRSQLVLSNKAPKLSSHFESSIPGLFFVGPAAVDSFGPLLRFACGAKFTASRLSDHLARASRFPERRTTAAASEAAYSGLQ